MSEMSTLSLFIVLKRGLSGVIVRCLVFFEVGSPTFRTREKDTILRDYYIEDVVVSLGRLKRLCTFGGLLKILVRIFVF